MAAISRLEHARDRLAQDAQVAVLDVPPVLAQVYGDAVGARELAQRGRHDGVGVARAALLAQRRDVVDVDVEANHDARASSRLRQSAISAACTLMRPRSVPSIMTRAFDSVPE